MKYLLALLLFPATAFAQSIVPGKTNQLLIYNLSQVQYSQTLTVSGGNGGPRNYVGLFADSSPTAVRLDWLYLDNTKDVTKPRNLTAGVVTFAGLTLPSYEIRLFNWTAAGTEGDVVSKLTIMAPTTALERRDLPVEGNVTVQRVPVGNRDEIRIKRADGDEERFTIDRGVQFSLHPVTDVTLPPPAVTP